MRLGLVLILCIMTSRSEVYIKESVVDPFMLIMETQNTIMNKINEIDAKLNDLQKANPLRLENKQASTIHNSFDDQILSKVEERITNLTNEAILMIETRVSSILLEARVGFKLNQNCHSYMNSIKQDVRNLLLKNSPSQPKAQIDNSTQSLHDLQHEIHSMNSTQDITNENQQLDIKLTSELLARINKNLQQGIVSTNNSFGKLDTMLQRIEYRQQVNNLARDRGIDVILRRLALHQSVLEERVTHSLDKGTQLLEKQLGRQEAALRNLTFMEDMLLTTLANIFSGKRNEALRFNLKTDQLGQEDTNGWLVAENDTEDLQDNLLTHVEEADLETNQDPSMDDTSTTKRSVISVLNSLRQFLGEKDDQTFEIGLQEQHRDNKKIGNEIYSLQTQGPTNVAKHNEDKCSGFNLSESSRNYLYDLEAATQRQLKEVNEKVSGLHIYQSSALHSHLKEVHFEMEKLQFTLTELLEKIGGKITAKIEITRKLLFTFIDAAVTSISSAAVTSSQTTGIQIGKMLQNILQSAFNQIRPNIWNKMPTCPGMFQKFGTKCLLILDSVEVPWTQACHLCSAIGGEIAFFSNQDQKDLNMIVPSLRSQKLWIRVPGNDRYNSTCEEQDDPLDSSPSSEECRDIEGVSPCGTPLGVICQYERHGQNQTLVRMSAELASLIEHAKKSNPYV